MSWEAISVIVNSILAGATLWIIYLNRQQVKASQKQAEAGEEQVRVSREQFQQGIDASQRPFLFPTTALPLKVGSDGSSHFDFEQLDVNWPDDMEDELGGNQVLGLKNVGAGIALNILAVIAEARPRDAEMVLNDVPGGPIRIRDEAFNRVPRLRNVTFDTALPPGELAKGTHREGGYIIHWNTIVSDDPRNTLTAPATPTEEHPYRIVARLTIIYDDIFGHMYASQFDFNDRKHWEYHSFVEVRNGIPELKRSRR